MRPPTSALPAEDLATYLRDYPQEITFGDQPPAVAFDRYHHPDIRWVNDGLSLDRQRLLAHVESARKRATGVDIEVLDAVREDDRVAARYVLTARMRKGADVVTEIYMFGRLAPDGRLQRVDQVTRVP